MKKIVLYILYISYALEAYPQALKPNSRLDLTFSWLPQTNWLINPNDYNAYIEKDYTLNYSLTNFGASVGIYSKSYAGVSLGLYFSQGGQGYIIRDIEQGEVLDEFRTNTRLFFYKLPLLFSYKADPGAIKGRGKRSKLFFEFGPQLSVVKEANYSERGKRIEYYNNAIGNEIPHKDFFKPYVIDLVLGIGGNYGITEKLFIHFQVRFDFGLMDIEDKNYILNGESFYPVNRLAANAATAGLVLGIGYKLFQF